MKDCPRLIAALLALALSACAGYSVKDDIDADGNKKKDLPQGIRYYEPAPFLLVYSDGKGNLTSQIITMPDLSKRRVIDLYAYAAKNNSTLDFTNGVLTKSQMLVDSTAVPAALLDTIKTLGVEAIGAAFNAPRSGTTHSIPAPYLFKIVIDKDGTRLVGGQGTGPDRKPMTLHISVTKEAATKSDAGAEAAKPAAGAAAPATAATAPAGGN